jgi:hypothetical protein
MPKSLCLGPTANNYMTPAEWARTAVPFLLRLGPGDNGKQLEIPQDQAPASLQGH